MMETWLNREGRLGRDLWLEAFLRAAPYVLGAIFTAGVVHLGAVLTLPSFSPLSAYGRLAAQTEAFSLKVLPPVSTETPSLPFADPFAALAVCRYDLSKGPLHVKVAGDGDRLLSVSAHSRAGVVFYASTDRDVPQRTLNILVMTQAQASAREEGDADETPNGELLLTAPEAEGFVLIRSLALNQSDFSQARKVLDGAVCALEKTD